MISRFTRFKIRSRVSRLPARTPGLNHFPGGAEECAEQSARRCPGCEADTRPTPAEHRGTAPLPTPQALPAGGRMAGGDILYKALLHARDPGRAVGMVGCQHHAARVLHLHGQRHMPAPLLVAQRPGGSPGDPVTRPGPWPGPAAGHRRLSGELWHRDTAPLPVSPAELAYIQKHRPQNKPRGSYYVPRKRET